MGLMKILARRPGKSTPEPRPYEFEPPVGSSLQIAHEGFVENPEVLVPSRFLRPQLSMNSITSKGSLEPSLYRHRNLSSVGRPGTAASSDSMYLDHLRGLQRPKREPRRPPVSFRKPSSTPSLSTSYQASSPEDRSSEVGSFVGLQRGRSNSVTSASSGRFKDLLDAQEEIRPIDFRTRLEATGARDYGEDVADRNMRQNSTGGNVLFSHSVPHVQDLSGPDLSCRSGRSESLTPGLRTKSLTSSSLQQPQHSSAYTTKSRLEPPVPDTASLKDSANRINGTKLNTKRSSIHTYTPSGLNLFSKSSFTTIRDGVKKPIWPSLGLGDTSRPHCVSPTGSNFSVPRSPKPGVDPSRSASEITRANIASLDVDSSDEERMDEFPAPTASGRQLSLGSRVTHFSLPKAATTSRLNNQNYRYSFASSITSRHTSCDYTALDYPKISSYDKNGLIDSDGCQGQEKSTSSCTQSQVMSGDESLGHISTVSSGLRPGPSASKGSSYVEDRSSRQHPGITLEWEPPASSNAGSASSASNPSYSGSSGRPQSRHTKATSVDSEYLPLSSRRSEESCRSTTFGGQPASSPGWSPMLTDFNIYDYISSDEESFTTERKTRRPLAEGEEDLLFKAGYGSTGAALPGLSETLPSPSEALVEDACPSPIIKDTRDMDMENSLSDDSEDLDVVDPAEIEDDRISVDRDLPATFLQRTRNVLAPKKSVKGKSRTPCRPVVTKVTSMANTEASFASGDSEYYTPPASADGLYMYDEEPTLQRGLQRLSAFGTWHGRDFVAPESVDRFGPHANKDGSSLSLENNNNINNSIGSSSKESTEKIDVVAAVRLRKAVKAQKRAEDAIQNQQKRLTRTFGNLEEEIAALLRMQNQEEGVVDNGDKLDRDRAIMRHGARSDMITTTN